MGRVTRKHDIARRRRRTQKIKKIRQRIAKAKDANQVAKLVAKIKKLNCLYPVANLNK